MELDKHQDGSSSDISYVDPAEILNSIKDIDDLDAELFGPKKTSAPSAKVLTPSTTKTGGSGSGKKKVSFQDPVDLPAAARSPIKEISQRKKDDFDFDLDDPLAGLLSDDDDDDALTPSMGVSKNKGGAKKDSSADDWLFADDNADDLLDDGTNKARDRVKREESRAKLSVESLMKPSKPDDLLKKSSPSARKMTLDDFASNAAKISPEKLASPYTTAGPSSVAKEIKFDDEFGFGSYQPSLSSPGDTKKKGRSRRPQADSSGFFDFLTEDEGVKSPPQDNIGTKTLTPPHQQSSVTRPATANVSMPSTTSVNKLPEPRPRSSEPIKSPLTTLSSTPQKPDVVYDTPVFTSSPERPLLREEDPTVDSKQKASPLVNSQPPRLSRRSTEPFSASSFPLNDKLSESAPKGHAPPLTHTMTTSRIPQAFGPQEFMANGEEAHAQSLGTQLAHTRALLHNVELGYKADLELAKTTYDSRIELLKTSFEDLKSRVDRELGSVRESYSARISVLRIAMQSQVQADTSKECDHQEEIKRLRNLHLQALNECRHDGDSQITRLREAHTSEVEAIKNSTYHARNIESMVSEVEESTGKLQQLSSKYEAAYQAMTRQSETVTLGNKQLISVVQNQLSQQQRSTSDSQIQMQQTASRLEGLVSEMNRKMDEQHYAMQLSHSNLQSAHTALQEERKQFMQQITLEREHLRKAHREIITLQSDIRQEAREDRAKVLRAADELSNIATRSEEARIYGGEQANRRNREHEEAMNNLNMETMELAKKKAQLESGHDKLTSQRQDLNNKLTQFNDEKHILQQIQYELEQREAEMSAMNQKAIDSEADKERVYADAKRIEGDQSRKLAEIHNEMNELTKQRQLLAEERKSLAQERSSGGYAGAGSPLLMSPIHPVASASVAVTPVKRRLMIAHPGSPTETSSAGLVLWKHSAKKDRSFLDDEQFFLETLKNSPYGKK